MRVIQALAGAALCALASAQSASTTYYDPTSGITYSSITQTDVTFNVALSSSATTSDAILQIVAPVTYGWCGFAWGGHMIDNPLTVAWPNGASTVVSSRWTDAYAIPAPYPNATYTPIKGPSSNSTHWTTTTRCQGCTIFGSTNIQNETEAVFAYACATLPPTTPSSNTSDIAEHDVFNIWGQDLGAAKNASYASWVGKSGNASEKRFWA